MEQLQQNPAVRTHEDLRTEPNYINLEPALPGGGGGPGSFQTISTYSDPTQLINSNYHIHPANYYTIEQMHTIPGGPPVPQNHFHVQSSDLQQQYPNDQAMMSELSAEDLKSDDDINKQKLSKATHNNYYFVSFNSYVHLATFVKSDKERFGGV